MVGAAQAHSLRCSPRTLLWNRAVGSPLFTCIYPAQNPARRYNTTKLDHHHASASATLPVPRLLCNTGNAITKQWVAQNNPSFWSPRELLASDASFFPAEQSLAVKRSSTSRFFMYEEHGGVKLKDDNVNGPTQVLQRSPSELAALLHEEARGEQKIYHYWTSPIADIAPDLLSRLQGYESLHDDYKETSSSSLLDPRGPSLWMGNSGSATQAHYDVADNVIVQLFGTKRVRCYHPAHAVQLHVFPDAHPRARKSQANFDEPTNTPHSNHDRFPHFASLPAPFLDVVLTPGDALQIPAFWFHHLENGRVPGSELPICSEDGPSVSLNMFAISTPMRIAQGIFSDASRPFGFLAATGNNGTDDATAAALERERHFEFTAAALRALGWGLLEGLGVQGSPGAYIRKSLLDTRYAPLRFGSPELNLSRDSSCGRVGIHQRRRLTAEEEELVATCIERIIPQFGALRGGEHQDDDDADGVSLLVACHVLELWAVELVGALAVEEAWESALSLDD